MYFQTCGIPVLSSNKYYFSYAFATWFCTDDNTVNAKEKKTLNLMLMFAPLGACLVKQ